MANNKTRMTIEIGYNVNKAGLQQLQSNLQQIAFASQEPGKKLNSGLQQAGKTASQLNKILDSTFDSKTGSLNVMRFNKELSKAGLSISKIKTDLQQVHGGSSAFNGLATSVLGTNLQLKESNKLLDDLATSMTNTVKWGVTASIFNTITGAVQKAVGYAHKLNSVLTDIRIVTGKSSEEMDKFAVTANRAAKELKSSTTDYASASLIYYQQGLSEEDVQARAETTVKAANVTRQSAQQTSEQLTAVWNGYRVQAEETEMYVDKLGAVAAKTASDLREQAVAMSKTASAANILGVDIDQLNAILATTISVTKQAPESIGTAYKTIFARMGDLKLKGADEDGVTLGTVTKDLAKANINVLDPVTGDLREIGKVIDEVGNKWDSWSKGEQQAIAIAMAGKRQYNNLMALFSNWDMYKEAFETSKNSLGALQEQQDIFAESTTAKLQELETAWESLYHNIIRDDEVHAIIGVGKEIVTTIDSMIDSFGRGIPALSAFGSMFLNVFDEQIGKALIRAKHNQDSYQQNLNLLEAQKEIIRNGISKETGKATATQLAEQAGAETQLNIAKELLQIKKGLTSEEYNNLVALQKNVGELTKQKTLITETAKTLQSKAQKEDSPAKQWFGAFAGQKDVSLGDLRDNWDVLKEANSMLAKDLKQIGTELDPDSIIDIFEGINQDRQNFSKQQNLYIQQIKDNINQSDRTVRDTEALNAAIKQLTLATEKRAEVITNQEKNIVNPYIKGQEKLVDVEPQLKYAQKDVDQQIEAGRQAQTIKDTTTVLTSSISGIATAWSLSATTLDTIADKTKTSSEKITEVGMSWAVMLPMMIKDLMDFSSALQNFDLKSVLPKVPGFKTIKDFNQNRHQVTDLKDALAAQMARKAHFEEKISSLTHNRGSAVTTQNALNTLNKQIAITQASLASAKATGAKAMSTLKVGAYAAGAAIAVALVAAIIKYQEALRKARIERNKTELASIDSAIQERKENAKTAETYEQVLEQYKKGLATKKELIAAADAVGKAYDIENAHVLALTGSYEALTRQMKAKRDADREKTLQDLDTASILNDALAKDEYKEDLSFFQETYRATGTTTADAVLKSNNVVNDRGYVDFSQGISSLYENTQKALQELKSKDLVEGEPVYKLLVSILKSLEDNYQRDSEIKQQTLDIQSAKAVDVVTADKNINSQDSFNKAINKIDLPSNLASKGVDLSEYRDEIVRQLLDKTNFSKYAVSYANDSMLKGIIKDKFGEIDEVTAEAFVKNLSDSAKQVFVENPEIFKGSLIQNLDTKKLGLLDGNTANILNSFGDYSKHANALSFTRGAANTAYQKSGVSVEDASLLYSQTNIGQMTGVKLDQFQGMDYAEQAHVMEEYYAKEQEWIKNNQTLQANKLKELRQAYEDAANGAISDNNRDKYNALFELEDSEPLKEITDELGQSKEVVREQIKEIAKVMADDEVLSEAQQKLKENILKAFDLSEEDFASLMGDLSKKIDFDEAGEKISEQVKTIGAAAEESLITLEYVEGKFAAINKSIDDTQAAYQSLTTAVDEYNESGFLTIDTAQALLALKPEYLAMLDFENGKLSLNKESLMQIMEARKEEAKATLYQKAEMQLLAIELKYGIETTIEYGVAALKTAEAVNELGISAEETRRRIAILNQELQKSGNSAAQAEAKKVQEALTNGLKVIDAIGTGANFDTAMAKPKKSGSKGSGGSRQEKKQLNYEKEFDKFHDIKKAIEDVGDAMHDLERDQKHLSGGALIDSLKIENQLLEKQTQNYKKLLDAQLKEAGALQEVLKGYGMTFDASGAITNYAAATVAALQKYNDAIAKYNAGLLTASQLSVYENNYKEFKEVLKQYETLIHKDIVETENKIQDAEDEIRSNNLKAWETELKLKLDMSEAKRDWADFVKDVNSDFKATYRDLNKIFDNLKEKAGTFLGGDGTISTEIGAIHELVGEIDNLEAGGTSDKFANMSEAQEKLKELRDSLMEHGRDLHDMWEEAWDTYMEGIDQASDKLEDLMSAFERIDDELDYQNNLIQLLYGTEAFGLMSKLYDAQLKNGVVQIDSLRQQRDMWKQMYDTAEAGTEEQTKYYHLWAEAQQNLNDKVIEYLELLKDDYLNTIDDILDKLDKKMTGGKGLEEAQKEWDKAKEHAEKYYDNVEKITQLEMLESKWQKAIGDAPLERQEELTKLMNMQLDALKGRNDLTEYDILLSEKKLSVAQAQMALEQAQNNLTSMKVTRDAKGDWVYQYIADENNVASKEEDLAQAYNDLYQLVQKTQTEALDNILNLHAKYLETIKQIAADETLTQEEKLAKQDEVTKQYLADLAIAQGEAARYTQDLNQVTAETLWGLYQIDQENYELMTEAEKALVDELKEHNITNFTEMEEFINTSFDEIKDKCDQVVNDNMVTWDTAAKDMADAWAADDGASVKSMVLEALSQMQTATEDYKTRVDEASQAAQDNFYDVEGSIQKAEQATDSLRDATSKLCSEAVSNLQAYKAAVAELEAAWMSVKDAIMQALQLANEYINKQSHYTGPATPDRNIPGGGAGRPNSVTPGGSGGSGGGWGGNSSPNNTQQQYMIVERNSYDPISGPYTSRADAIQAWQSEEAGNSAYNVVTYEDYLADVQRQNKERRQSPQKAHLPGRMNNFHLQAPFNQFPWHKEFDTGGYTGDWGSSEGKVAVLHEKELVLNKQDTQNILHTVNMVRDLFKGGLDIGAMLKQGILSTISAWSNLSTPPSIINNNEQKATNIDNKPIEIHAEFPNANDVTSIKEALLSLPRLASQYINQR